jgi:hypothetical protein
MVSDTGDYHMTVADMLEQLSLVVEDLKRLPPNVEVYHRWVEYHPRAEVMRKRLDALSLQDDCTPILTFPVLDDDKVRVFVFMVLNGDLPPEWFVNVEEGQPE